MLSNLLKKIWPLAALTTMTLGAYADTIVLKDGREYEGTLERATPETIFFRRNSHLEEFPRAQVVHVRLQKKRLWSELETASAIPDPILQQALKTAIQPADYPGAATVTLYRATTIKLQTAHTWVQSNRQIIRILNEHGEDASIQELLYRPEHERAGIMYGMSIREDGTLIHLHDSAVQDESPYHNFPRYDTLRRRRFALPEGKPGVVLNFESQVERFSPLDNEPFFAEFLLGDTEPVLEMQVQVVVPAGIPCHWRVMNDEQNTVTHATEDMPGGASRHTWTRRHSPQLIPEPLQPPWSNLIPRLVVTTEERDSTALAHHFQQILAECEKRYPAVPEPPSHDAAELWAYLSRNIQSADVPLLATGFEPGDPTQTWQLRNGAPIDRTYLLYRWLRMLGYEVHWLWIRPRWNGRLDTSTLALAAFTTPGLKVVMPDQPPLYLIPGDELDALPESTARMADAPALNMHDGQLLNLPTPAPMQTGIDREVRVRLNSQGHAQVTEEVTYRGQEARWLRSWRRKTKTEITNEIRQLVTGRTPGAQNINWKVQGDISENQPLMKLELQYQVPHLADIGKQLCSLQPPWLAYQARAVGRDSREWPLYRRLPSRDTVAVAITPPPGFSLVAQVQPELCESPFATVRITTENPKQGPNQCRVEQIEDRLSAPATAYPGLKHCLQRRANAGRQYWVWQRQ